MWRERIQIIAASRATNVFINDKTLSTENDVYRRSHSEREREGNQIREFPAEGKVASRD